MGAKQSGWITVAVAAALIGAATAAAELNGDPGRLPQTRVLPSATAPSFEARMRILWRGIAAGSSGRAAPAFFPRAAYVQVKAVADPAADYRLRLLPAFAADIAAAHRLLAAHRGRAVFLRVVVPSLWAWIAPGGCYNRVGYWHAPGARLEYRQGGVARSFGIYSLISWRGAWYVVHLGLWNRPGSIVAPAIGLGSFGPPGGC